MIRILEVIARKARSAIIRLKRLVISQRFGFSPDLIYKDRFYDDGGFWMTKDAARAIAKYFQEAVSPSSVLDIGCGPGEYLMAFSELGVKAVGCDGSSSGIRRIPQSVFAFHHDLRKPLITNTRYDLTICIEVAEHLPKSSSKILIDSICGSSTGLVVFTAAPPGVPGEDHINCQPVGYWEKLFNVNRFQLDRLATRQLREFAVVNKLPAWWQEWSYVFRKATA